MLPLLFLLGDREPHAYKKIIEKLAHQFELTEEERFALNPKGDKYLFNNRLSWAISVLEEIDYLTKQSDGLLKITKHGVIALNNAVTEERILALRPLYNDDVLFQQNEARKSGVIFIGRASTQEEILKNTYQGIHEKLAKELLKKVQENTPQFFERLVIKLLVKMGYGGTFAEASAKVTGRTHDEGIDGIINQDRLGLDSVYIQAKRWGKVVGRPEIQKFVGALHGLGAKKGVFVTTSSFSSVAKNYIKSLAVRVVLIDGPYLAQLMIENNIGVYVQASYEVKAIDTDFFTYE